MAHCSMRPSVASCKLTTMSHALGAAVPQSAVRRRCAVAVRAAALRCACAGRSRRSGRASPTSGTCRACSPVRRAPSRTARIRLHWLDYNWYSPKSRLTAGGLGHLQHHLRREPHPAMQVDVYLVVGRMRRAGIVVEARCERLRVELTECDTKCDVNQTGLLCRCDHANETSQLVGLTATGAANCTTGPGVGRSAQRMAFYRKNVTLRK